MAQTSCGLSGAFWPTSLPLFHGIHVAHQPPDLVRAEMRHDGARVPGVTRGKPDPIRRRMAGEIEQGQPLILRYEGPFQANPVRAGLSRVQHVGFPHLNPQFRPAGEGGKVFRCGAVAEDCAQ